MSAPDANGWQPIETAPKDGTSFLAWNGEYANIATYVDAADDDKGFRVEAFYVGENGGSMGWVAVWPEFTHFQPLPKPPVGA